MSSTAIATETLTAPPMSTPGSRCRLVARNAPQTLMRRTANRRRRRCRCFGVCRRAGQVSPAPTQVDL